MYLLTEWEGRTEEYLPDLGYMLPYPGATLQEVRIEQIFFTVRSSLSQSEGFLSNDHFVFFLVKEERVNDISSRTVGVFPRVPVLSA